MLATEFVFYIHVGDKGYKHIYVTRLKDGAEKYFFQCGGTVEGLISFFNSMTDELLEGYWPKKASGVDNWAFLGENPDRWIGLELARKESGPARTAYALTGETISKYTKP